MTYNVFRGTLNPTQSISLVADRFEAGRGPVVDLLARASLLLAS